MSFLSLLKPEQSDDYRRWLMDPAEYMRKKNSTSDGTSASSSIVLANSINLVPKNETEESLGKFNADFGSLLKSCDFSDAEIEFGSAFGSEVIKVHKAILAGRSKYFMDYFKSNGSSIIQIEGFAQEIVKSMLEHTYSGKTEIVEDNVKELYQIGKKFGLKDLQNDSENFLVKLLKVDNCIKILKFSDSEGTSLVKSKAIAYIIANKGEVSSSPDFLELLDSNDKLCIEILKVDYVDHGGSKRLKIFHSTTT